jgi:hypothetical protein
VALQCWRSAGTVRAAAVVLPVAAPLALPELAVVLLADDPVEAEAAALEEPVAVDDVEAGELVAAVDVAEVGDAEDAEDATEVVAADEVVAAEEVRAADDGDVVAADDAAEETLVAEPALLLEAALPLLPQPESAKMRTSDVKYRRRRSTGLLLCDPRSAEQHGGKKHAKRGARSVGAAWHRLCAVPRRGGGAARRRAPGEYPSRRYTWCGRSRKEGSPPCRLRTSFRPVCAAHTWPTSSSCR